MRVRYLGGSDQDGPGAEALVRGREYSVLEISTAAGRDSYFRIEVAADGAPALFDISLFEQTCSAIPSNWRVSLGLDGLLTIGPEAWRKTGFWEAFLGREEWAVKVFNEEKVRSLA